MYQIYGLVPTSQFHRLAAIPTGLVTRLCLGLGMMTASCELTIPSWTSTQNPTILFLTNKYGQYSWRSASICVEDRTNIDAENNGANSNVQISLKHHYATIVGKVVTRWRVFDVGGAISPFNPRTDSLEGATRLLGSSGLISLDGVNTAWPPAWKHRIKRRIVVCWYSGRFLTHGDGDDDNPYKLWSCDSTG